MNAPYHVDHVIGENRPTSRAEQREATRAAILEAAAQCLQDDGYAALTTRRVAEGARVAQSTLMHHFPTREALLVETVGLLALRVADGALEQVELAAITEPRRREDVLDGIWRQFTSPEGLAAAQIWFAAGAEPELAAALRDLEVRLLSLWQAMTASVAPQLLDDDGFTAFVGLGLDVIRGLVMAIPVWGREVVEERWTATRPVLARAGDGLL